MIHIALFLAIAAADPDAGAPAIVVDAGAPTNVAVAVDAGTPIGAAHDAGTPNATTTTTTTTTEEAIAATVHDRQSPLRFRGKNARARANDASSALTAALEAEAIEGKPQASVRVQDGVAVVEVRGRSVATLTEADADAEHMTLARYAPELETRLISFVKEEERRSSLQAVALRVFFSVFLLVIGLVTLRALRSAFSKFDERLEERGVPPLVFLGQTLLSSDALRGLLAVGFVAGRIFAYVGVVAVVLGAVLGQFEATRPLLARLGGWAAAPILHAMDALVSAVPGLVLAGLLVIGVRAAFRFLKVLLDGVADGRVQNGVVAPARAFPARVAASAMIAIVTAPIIVAAAFGRFGTPLETLALAAGGVTLLASVPLLASAIAGVVVLWRGAMKPGDWIEVRGARGEVASVHVLDFVLVPEDGGTVRIPYLAIAASPTKIVAAPRATLDVVVKRDRALGDIEAALAKVVHAVSEDAAVSLTSLHAECVRCTLTTPAKPGARDALVRALAIAVENGDVALAG